MKRSTINNNHTNILVLYKLAQLYSINLLDKDKIGLICFTNFVSYFHQIIKNYIHDTTSNIKFLSHYVIAYFMNKYEKKYRCVNLLSSFLHSWKKYTQQSAQARLYQSFLKDKQNKNELKAFLKIHKQLKRCYNSDILDKICLSHQQAIGIIHRLYKQQQKREICKKLNKFYIDLNYKINSNAKLKSCIFIEFLMEYIVISNQAEKQNQTYVIKSPKQNKQKQQLIKTKQFIKAFGQQQQQVNNVQVQQNQSNCNLFKQQNHKTYNFFPSEIQCISNKFNIQSSSISSKMNTKKEDDEVTVNKDIWQQLLKKNEKFKNKLLRKSNEFSEKLSDQNQYLKKIPNTTQNLFFRDYCQTSNKL